MQLDVKNNNTAIPINEIYGKPTIQGEGEDMGMPCIFIRTHYCPVQCPGCDTYFTWDGSESANLMDIATIRTQLINLFTMYPGCGLVVSGGEPMLLYKNIPWHKLLVGMNAYINPDYGITLETSGFISKACVTDTESVSSLFGYLSIFRRIHVSPKITPCLHGKYKDSELTSNVGQLLHCTHTGRANKTLVFKFVVRDEEDISVVAKFQKEWEQHSAWTYDRSEPPIHIMAYGITEKDVRECTTNVLIPAAAKYGWRITPRIHTLLWGTTRGV